MTTIDTILLKVFLPLISTAVAAVSGILWRTVTSQTRMKVIQEQHAKRLNLANDKISNITTDLASCRTDVNVLKNDIAYIRSGIDEIKAEIRDIKR